MKVLIIDDDSLVRRSLKRALKSRGHDVEEAEDGEAGLEKWLNTQPEVIFLDVLMPKMTGPQVLKQMQGKEKGYTILMSAYSGEDHIETVESLGADEFISKPFDDIFQVVELAEKNQMR